MSAGGDKRPAHLRERSARQQAAVLRLRREGVTALEIAADREIWGDAAPVPLTRVNTVWRQALKGIKAEEATLARAKLADGYDALRRKVWGVANARHVVVQGGKIMRAGDWRVLDNEEIIPNGAVTRTEDGVTYVWDDSASDPLTDHGPVLAAAAELRKIMEAEARLFGLNLPVRIDMGGNVDVTYVIKGVDTDDVK